MFRHYEKWLSTTFILTFQSLLSMPSTREKQSKQVGEEILELLTKPTAKERSVAEKFKSHGGAQVMEFCPHGTKIECIKAQQATAEMAKAKKKRESKLKDSSKDATLPDTVLKMQLETDEDVANCAEEHAIMALAVDGEETEDGEIVSDNLKDGDAESQQSIEDGEYTTDTCTKLHFKKIIQSHTDESLGDCSFLNTCFHMATCK